MVLDGKIGVIGLGVVGGAIHRYFCERHDQVVGYDLYQGVGDFSSCLTVGHLYLCLPTRFDEDTKTYDLSEVEKTLQLLDESAFAGLVVIKSTLLPGTTERLAQKHAKLTVVHHPEFLKARSAYEDYASQTRLIYGLPGRLQRKRGLKGRIRDLNKHLHPKARTIFAGSSESEMIKLMSNSYYATQVQFFNEIYQLCGQIDCQYDRVIGLLKRTGLDRIDCTRVPGPDGKLSYSGMCLPKDSNALLGLMERTGSIHHQLKATVQERNSMRQDEVNVISSVEGMVTMYDPKRDYRRHQIEYLNAIESVLASGQYIGGPPVARLEQQLADYVGVKHCWGVSSGTDALLIALMALGVKAGDEILTVSFSWVSTVTMIELLGARPVFVDIDPDDFNMDCCCLQSRVTERTRGIVVVSLFGQMAELDAINRFAARHKLFVIEDGAQSFGATSQDRKSCSLTTVGTTSFFPTKPLGCFGDGGAVFTNDSDLATRMRAIRDHGAVERPRHLYLGINGRLDTVQAAVLLAKLPRLDRQLAERRDHAEYYRLKLSGLAKAGHFLLPKVKEGYAHVWAQYTICLQRPDDRELLLKRAQEEKINLAVFYPVPIHQQPFLAREETLPVTGMLSERVVSLPVYPELTQEEQDRVIELLTSYFQN
jgi:UDP-2-acetamido-2-deoxy-ribo-hexuluronate aminotransferase